MKKALPAAIALAGTMGFAAAANAVNVNHDGLGQVLLYSYYTTEDGNDTQINITNTTNQVKAVKVRFVEAMNSQEVLDFNLYLSPKDVWIGDVVRTANGAKLITPDTSCTVPAIPASGVEFRNYQYQGASYKDGKGGPQGTDRTRTGYLEVIEMGTVNDVPLTVWNGTAYVPEYLGIPSTVTPATWATHVNGTPALCAGVVAMWSVTNGRAGPWKSSSDLYMSAPTGGLYGNALIVNVDSGTAISPLVTTLDNFRTDGNNLHQAPGSLLPSLEQAFPPVFTLDDGTTGVPAPRPAVVDGEVVTQVNGIDAVSAVLQKAHIMNDYLTLDALNASTDWVVTMPTKRFYVNDWTPADKDSDFIVDDDTVSPEPFTNFWTKTEFNDVAGSACEPVGIVAFDQEERGQSEGLDFSPAPPGDAPFALCFEANVIGFNGTSVLGNSYTRANLDLNYDAGWVDVDLTGEVESAGNGVTYDREIATNIGYLEGLPVIGFATTAFQNGDVGGLQSNYAGDSEHKAIQYCYDGPCSNID